MPSLDDCDCVWPTWWGKRFTLMHYLVLVLETGTFSSLKVKVGLSLFDRILSPDEITSVPDVANKVCECYALDIGVRNWDV